jgi:hypothetical protein
MESSAKACASWVWWPLRWIVVRCCKIWWIVVWRNAVQRIVVSRMNIVPRYKSGTRHYCITWFRHLVPHQNWCVITEPRKIFLLAERASLPGHTGEEEQERNSGVDFMKHFRPKLTYKTRLVKFIIVTLYYCPWNSDKFIYWFLDGYLSKIFGRNGVL